VVRPGEETCRGRGRRGNPSAEAAGTEINPTAGDGGRQRVDFGGTATADIIDRSGTQWGRRQNTTMPAVGVYE
jgi:hypothetical protein